MNNLKELSSERSAPVHSFHFLPQFVYVVLLCCIYMYLLKVFLGTDMKDLFV